MPTLATFNANNFFLRYRFTRTYPGDQSRKSLVEAAEVGSLGYLPGLAFGHYPSSYIVWDAQRRELGARGLKEPDGQLPDILCLQEVENIQAIRIFNQSYLDNHYPYSLLIDSYDARNIDVGLLSTFPIGEIRSHIDDVNEKGERIFSRDCLEAEIQLPDGSTLSLLLNHLKSKLVTREPDDTDAQYKRKVKDSHEKRMAQAQKVVEYIAQRFRGRHATALYAVVGDCNDTPYSPWLAPLMRSSRLTDVLGKYRPRDRWTYYYRSENRVSQIDYILASHALATRVANVIQADPAKAPHIERQGLAYRQLNSSGQVLPREATLVYVEDDDVTPVPPGAPADEKVSFGFPRYPEVMTDWKANTSDHCPVKVWF